MRVRVSGRSEFRGCAITTHTPPKTKSQKVSETQRTRRRMHHLARSRGANVQRVSVGTRRHRYYERFTRSSFAEGIGLATTRPGKIRSSARRHLNALGNMNGTVVAIEPTSGRILAMVNQKLALSSGAQPCSTIKFSVALAALSEGVVSKETPVSLGRRYQMNLTTALAHSNNAYFEALGRKLGFEKVAYYAHNTVWESSPDTTFRASSLARIPTKRFLKSWAALARCARSAKAFP